MGKIPDASTDKELKDVFHKDSEELPLRRLRDVFVDHEDDHFSYFRQRDGSIIQLAKRVIVRIEPAWRAAARVRNYIDDRRGVEMDQIAEWIRQHPEATDRDVTRACDCTIQQVEIARRGMTR